MAGPLHGVRVLDLSTALSGPVATMLLADQGAEVIKLEAPGMGDVTRVVGSHHQGMRAMYQLANRGKRSITLDLSDEEAKAVFFTMAASMDVIVQNFRPGVVDRMGIGYDDVRRVNPNVIYLSIAGFGFSGPLAQEKVYDNLIQAASGFAATQGDADGPRYVRNLVCDKITALTAAQAVTAALFARAQGNGGQHIRLAMLDAAAWFLWPDAGTPFALLDPEATTIDSNRSNELVPHLDGWTTSAPVTDAEFRGWCLAFDAPDVADDPRWATVTQRLEGDGYIEVRREVAQRASKLTVREALDRLARHGVSAVEAIALDALVTHDQAVANDTFTVTEHPIAGPIREVNPPARFSATPASPGAGAGLPGQHTDEVLREFGLGDEEITALRARGVAQ
jgi:crotonobetainyl-CoA:carnitine CoA-transferase CaiB-like acyl-CoA transferase